MRRCPCLGMKAGSGCQSIRGDVVPHDAPWLQVSRLDRRLRGVDRSAGMDQIAGRTAAIMRARLAGLIALAGVRSAVVMTDRRPTQRVGRDDGGRPTCSDRRKNLHRHSHQDDRKEFPQPPAHQHKPIPSAQLTNHAGSLVSRLGSCQTDLRRGKIRIRTEADDEITCRQRGCCVTPVLPG